MAASEWVGRVDITVAGDAECRGVGLAGDVSRGLLADFTDPDAAVTRREFVSSMDLGVAAYTEEGRVSAAEESGCGRFTRITKLGRHGDTKVKLPHCSLSQTSVAVDVVSRSIIIIISLSISFVGCRRCASVTTRNKSIWWGLGDLGCDQLERATRGRLSQKCRAENLGVGMKPEGSRLSF